MRTGIFITIRSDSTRLPSKTFKKILDKPVLEHIIQRAKLCRNIDDIIVCTTEREVDNQIVEIAEKLGVKVFRGSLNDKLERWNGAAKKYNIDYIITFDGDDLFCEPTLIELGAEQIRQNEFDFIEAPEGLVCGAFTYAFTTNALNKVCKIKNSDDTEMMWTYFKDTGIFRTGYLKNVPDIFINDKIRLTLDYPEDFEMFTKIFEHYMCGSNDIPLNDIIEFLNENPHISEINLFRQQEFLANQQMKTKLVLKEKL